MPPLSKKVITWIAAGIATTTVAVVVMLWWLGTRGLEGDKLVTARFDALRTGLSIGLGGGGLFALYLAWRRQHSTEIGLAQKQQDQADVARAYELQREDSIDRRITDLYTKAVEQLGSEKAHVRLGGLYALERLAQNHAEQRQTIVNVLCAYLRMPYTLPGDPPTDNADNQLITDHRERTQEREVRLTAQRILSHHLHPGNDPKPVDTFWTDIELDLTRATLINFTLSNCSTQTAHFSNAVFIGDALFINATFSSDADFSNVTFSSHVGFSDATFSSNADFSKATFGSSAGFLNATFTGNAYFSGIIFALDAYFGNATFTSRANFEGATFTRNAYFSEATFVGSATFGAATFTSNAYFNDVTFTSNANFEGATFTSNPNLEGATFRMYGRGVPPQLKRFEAGPEDEARDVEGA